MNIEREIESIMVTEMVNTSTMLASFPGSHMWAWEWKKCKANSYSYNQDWLIAPNLLGFTSS